MHVYEALYTTRAMRRLKPDPIPLDVQARILDAAIRSPSGSNAQAWHFMFVDDPATRQQLAPLYLGVWKRRIEGEHGRYVPYSELTNPVLRSAGYLAEHFAETPLLLFGFARADAGSSIYPALWSAQLAARAEGVGSTLTTFLNREQDAVFSILGVPRDAGWQMYGCIPMGYPTGRWGVAARRPAHEVAGRNTWDGPLGFEVPEPLWQPPE